MSQSDSTPDFERICRLCMEEQESRSKIFSTLENLAVSLHQMIMTCTSIVIYEGDGLPDQICSKCLGIVKQSYFFREQAEQADAQLREILLKAQQNEAELKIDSRSMWSGASVCDFPGDVNDVVKTELLDEDHIDDAIEICYNKIEVASDDVEISGNEGNDDLEEGEVQYLGEFQPIAEVDCNSNGGVCSEETIDCNEKTPPNKCDKTSKLLETLLQQTGITVTKRRDPQRDSVIKKQSAIRTKAAVALANVQSQLRAKSAVAAAKRQSLLTRSSSALTTRQSPVGASSRQSLKNPRPNVAATNRAQTQKARPVVASSTKPSYMKSKAAAAIAKIDHLQSSLARMKAESKTDNLKWLHVRGVGSDRKADITKTVNEIGTEMEDGKIYCKECKVFISRPYFYNHVKFVHIKVRDHLCAQCGYRAQTGHILRHHIETVHCDSSHPCSECDKVFKSKKSLRKHIRQIHIQSSQKERSHICQFCGKGFFTAHYLRNHIRTHTNETPYKCKFCDRRFSFKWPCTTHERLHTGVKPYKCTFCSESFTQNCVRKNHEYRAHGNEEFNPKNRQPRQGLLREKKKKLEKKEPAAQPKVSSTSENDDS